MRVNKKATLLLVFLLSFFIPLAIYNLSVDNATAPQKAYFQETRNNAHIVSVPPTEAVAGSEWQYAITIDTYNKDDFFIVVKKPDWLTWQKDNLVFKGVVPSNIKSFNITIELLDKNENVIDTQSFEVKVVNSIGYTDQSTNTSQSNVPKVQVASINYNNIKTLQQQGIVYVNGSSAKNDTSNKAVLGASTSIPNTGVFDFGLPILGLALAILGGFLYIRHHKNSKQSELIVVSGEL